MKDGPRTLLYVAFPSGGFVERVDGGGHAKNAREEDELLADGMGVHILLVRMKKSIVVML